MDEMGGGGGIELGLCLEFEPRGARLQMLKSLPTCGGGEPLCGRGRRTVHRLVFYPDLSRTTRGKSRKRQYS